MTARKALLLVALVALLPVAVTRGGEIPLLPDGAPPALIVSPVAAAPPAAPAPVVGAAPVPANAPPALIAPPAALVPPAAPGPAPVAGAAPADVAGGRYWAEASPLIAFLSGGRVPALVTASVPGTPRAAAGVEGVDSTRTLFGDRTVNDGTARAGFLFRAGYCPDGASRQGFEVGVIWLQRQGDGFTARSNGDPILARPFFNLGTGLNDAELIAFPGVQAGEVRVRTASDLLGAEVNYRRPISCVCTDNGDLCCDSCGLDVLFGYRGLRYCDKVTIDEAVRPLGVPPSANRVQVSDAFYALNVFNGLQIGLGGRLQLDNLFFDGRLMTALGARLSSTDVTGSTTVVLPNGTVTRRPGGLLAATSNDGDDESIDLAFVGEFSLRMGYQITPNLSVSVGYTSLYFSSVKRAGALIDRANNTTQLPPGTLAGPGRPMLLGGDSDVWARALSLGVEWRY